MPNKVFKGSMFGYMKWHYHFEKSNWICADCGLVWFSQEQARYCSDRGHISTYTRNLGRYLNEYKAQGKIDKKTLIKLRLKKGHSVDSYFNRKNPLIKTDSGNISWKKTAIKLIGNDETKIAKNKEGKINWKITVINNLFGEM